MVYREKIHILPTTLLGSIGIAGRIGAGLPAHYLNCPLGNRQCLIRNHEIFIKLHLVTESVADRTGTKRIIKRKASRFHLIHTDSAIRARKILGKIHWFPVHHIYNRISSVSSKHFPGNRSDAFQFRVLPPDGLPQYQYCV